MIKFIVYIILFASLAFLLILIGSMNAKNSQSVGPVLVSVSIVLSGCLISASILACTKKGKP